MISLAPEVVSLALSKLEASDLRDLYECCPPLRGSNFDGVFNPQEISKREILLSYRGNKEEVEKEHSDRVSSLRKLLCCF